MTLDDIFKNLRILAKTDYYQTLYAQAKDFHFKLFKNSEDLTDIQIQFLGFLGFYSSLFVDVALGEVNDVIFKDEIYENAYAYYRQNSRREDMSKAKQPINENVLKKDTIQWVFKHRKKKVK